MLFSQRNSDILKKHCSVTWALVLNVMTIALLQCIVGNCMQAGSMSPLLSRVMVPFVLCVSCSVAVTLANTSLLFEVRLNGQYVAKDPAMLPAFGSRPCFRVSISEHSSLYFQQRAVEHPLS